MKTTAQEIMSTEVLTLREGATVEEALKLLMNNRITGTPVVNAQNEMIGVVSEYDLIRQISTMPNPDREVLTQKFNFTPGAQAIPHTAELQEVLHYLLDLKFRRLPVINEQKKLVGIITRRDIIRLFYYRARLT
jgi:CBS domain-containing protein